MKTYYIFTNCIMNSYFYKYGIDNLNFKLIHCSEIKDLYLYSITVSSITELKYYKEMLYSLDLMITRLEILCSSNFYNFKFYKECMQTLYRIKRDNKINKLINE